MVSCCKFRREVIGSKPLINKLSERFDIVITTTTPTGLRRAKEIYSEDIIINYAPWDLVLFINRFLKFYKPDAILIFETEIWPSMIAKAFEKNIPVYLVNGRLSHKSYQAYSMLLWLFNDILKRLLFLLSKQSSIKNAF